MISVPHYICNRCENGDHSQPLENDTSFKTTAKEENNIIVKNDSDISDDDLLKNDAYLNGQTLLRENLENDNYKKNNHLKPSQIC